MFFQNIKDIFGLLLRLIRKDWDWWRENWQDLKFRQQFCLVATGFGIAGLIWGMFMYKDIVLANDKSAFISPFHWIAILALAVFGGLGLGLAFFPKNKKRIIKLIILSIFAWVIAFVLPAIFSYPWLLFGGGVILFPLFLVLGYGFNFFGINYSHLADLYPSVMITSLWLEFFFTGLLISLFYAFMFKIKLKPLIIDSSLSLGLISLIAPIISNTFGFYLLNSLFLAYLITFFLICSVFSIYLFKGIKQNTNDK